MKTKTIDTLVEDIYGLFGDHEHVVDKDNIVAFAEDVASAVQSALADDGSRKYTIRASNVGKPCTRQSYYESQGAPREKLAPNVKLKFLYGHIIEAMLLLLAREAGHDVRDTQKRVELFGVTGHIDATIDGTLVDVKSASTYSFNKFKDGTLNETNDAFGYLTQLGFYDKAIHEDDKCDGPAFLAMDKQHAHLAVHKPSPLDLPSLSEIEAKVTHLKGVVKMDHAPTRALGFEPVPDGKSGNMKLGVNCSYCPYKVVCWAESGVKIRGFAYSNGPRYLTEVALLPKVHEFNPAEELE